MTARIRPGPAPRARDPRGGRPRGCLRSPPAWARVATRRKPGRRNVPSAPSRSARGTPMSRAAATNMSPAIPPTGSSKRIFPIPIPSLPGDEPGHEPGAESVVHVDHRDVGRAGVEHREQRGDAAQAGAVADRRGEAESPGLPRPQARPPRWGALPPSPPRRSRPRRGRGRRGVPATGAARPRPHRRSAAPERPSRRASPPPPRRPGRRSCRRSRPPPAPSPGGPSGRGRGCGRPGHSGSRAPPGAPAPPWPGRAG